MTISTHSFKNWVIKGLLIISLFIVTDGVQAKSYFSDEPVKEEKKDEIRKDKKKGKILKSIKKRVKDSKERIRKIPEKIKALKGADNKFGTIALWALLVSVVVGLLAGESLILGVIGFLASLTYLVTMILGLIKDENKKRAKWALWIGIIALILTAVGLFLVLLAFL